MSEKAGFFPVFLDIRQKKIVFIGGGKIAERRIRTLSEFDAEITVIAPAVTDDLKAMADAGEIEWIRSEYAEMLIEDADIVFSCTNDQKLNHEIASFCRAFGILVNNCSDHTECDFYFPGIVKKDNIVVGVTAGGESHAEAKEIRKKIGEIL